MGKRFKPQEDAFLIENHLFIPAKRMAKMLGRTEGTARQRMNLLGIKVPADVVERFRKESWIKAGTTPKNKGKKLHEYVSPAAIERIKSSQFKKGNLPCNTLHDGAIVTRRAKSGRYYKWIRISKANWKMLHVNIWEGANGPVPAGYIIVFANKDSADCRLENLELITLEENMRRNTIQNYPDDIKTSIRTVSKLKRKIKQHEEQIN